MPHAMFIGSKMATMRRLAPAQYVDEYSDNEDDDEKEEEEGSVKHEEEPGTSTAAPRPRASTSLGPSLHLPHPIPLGAFSLTAPRLTPEERTAAAAEDSSAEGGDDKGERPSPACVKAHLGHSVVGASPFPGGFLLLLGGG